ncbi:MAG TPA: hypothetical protein VF656_18640 [Pyrinomonadaceae bacterium]|jgi:hypothetical protein
MKCRSFVLAVLVLCATCAAATAQQSPKSKQAERPSRGAEFAILDNLWLRDAKSIEYAGEAEVEVYGNIYTASKFIVHDFVRVTVSGYDECLYDHAPFQPCEATKGAEIEVYAGVDETNEIHDLMLRKIYDYWTANRPGKGKTVEADEHLNYKDGEYIMFQTLRGQNSRDTRAKRLIWADGKFYKFRFGKFDLGATYNDIVKINLNADEALDNFVTLRKYVRPRAVKIQPKLMKGAFREEFFRLYESGAFGRLSPQPQDKLRPAKTLPSRASERSKG